jgi:hypothetical protein
MRLGLDTGHVGRSTGLTPDTLDRADS